MTRGADRLRWPPGAAKSTYYRTYFQPTHVCVSKDQFPGTRNRGARQLVILEEELKAGRDVVIIDNTNATPASRGPLLEMGRRFGARLIAYHFDVPVALCLARNRSREGRARVPDVAIYVTSKKLRVPTLEQGFDEIRTVGQDGQIDGRNETLV